MTNLTNRIIYHCDCNSFFASVEETFNPKYKKIPMAVAGNPETRHGIILAKNELAKKFGIVTAETVWSAKKKCPNLTLCPPRHNTYGEFCRRVNNIYEQYTEQVEQFGCDESFLDVTGSIHLFGQRDAAPNRALRTSTLETAVNLAHEIRERVEREIGITISVGVSWNRMFAKLASDLKKPNAVTVIDRENYKEIVWKLPASDLFLVGKNTAEKLRKNYIYTIGDLAKTDVNFLTKLFGKMGEQLHINANGLDDSPVTIAGTQAPAKSVGNGMTFKRDLVTLDDITIAVTALADTVSSRLRRVDLKCNTIQVTIKDPLLKSIQRQKSTQNPTYLTNDLTKTALEIIQQNWKIGNPIRMLTITAQNLAPTCQVIKQLDLFDNFDKLDNSETDVKMSNIEKTIDTIRGKYGQNSVLRGNVLRNDLGINEHGRE